MVLQDFLPDRRELLESFWRSVGQRHPGVAADDDQKWAALDGDAGRPMSQADFMWQLRLHPNVVRAFRGVHAVSSGDELCCSMDVYRAHARKQPDMLGLHVDQRRGPPGWKRLSVQGAYNFMGVGEDDSGLMVVPRSHFDWDSRESKARDTPANHGGTIGSGRLFKGGRQNKKNLELFEAYDSAVKLLLPPGCFVLFNSKLLHGCLPGTRTRPHEASVPQLNRLTAFVCWMPRPAALDKYGPPQRLTCGQGGDVVMARWTDGYYYEAKVLMKIGDTRKVRFLADGVEATLKAEEVANISWQGMLEHERKEAKRKLYLDGLGTSHWAALAVTHFPPAKATRALTPDGDVPPERLAAF